MPSVLSIPRRTVAVWCISNGREPLGRTPRDGYEGVRPGATRIRERRARRRSLVSRLLNGKQVGLSRPNIRKVAAGLGMTPAEVDELLPDPVAGQRAGSQDDIAARIARLDPRIRLAFYGILQEMESLTAEEAVPVLDDIE